MCRVHLLAGFMCTNKVSSLRLMVPLPDASAAAPATFEAMEQQTLTIFATCLLMRTSKFAEEDSSICFCCLH
jgi:hypothetical protein